MPFSITAPARFISVTSTLINPARTAPRTAGALCLPRAAPIENSVLRTAAREAPVTFRFRGKQSVLPSASNKYPQQLPAASRSLSSGSWYSFHILLFFSRLEVACPFNISFYPIDTRGKILGNAD